MREEDRTFDAMPLAVLLERTLDAFTALDADSIETLVDACRCVVLPASASEWEQAAHSYSTLGHLLGLTAQRLTILRGISTASIEFGAFVGRERR
ncbi:hypothetical protein ACPOL_1064 [Acidisarcina polymorpha]|uniref:Uncharacterized protein n=1 Tax=Acidisarcina polymorpha TaxID=2211140 RepID=A0A2Z5FVM2_9BACT|nr:hypothetical protein [Acidisarcina polymorpha]AXC10415.1 hypothetical protein ACPOL_1064 [Acidisarcina polymorpha]